MSHPLASNGKSGFKTAITFCQWSARQSANLPYWLVLEACRVELVSGIQPGLMSRHSRASLATCTNRVPVYTPSAYDGFFAPAHAYPGHLPFLDDPTSPMNPNYPLAWGHPSRCLQARSDIGIRGQSRFQDANGQSGMEAVDVSTRLRV